MWVAMGDDDRSGEGWRRMEDTYGMMVLAAL
jgi:hypothetical protein